MNYAVPSKQIFVTTKPISTKRKLTSEQKRRRDFLCSHYCDISVDNTNNTIKMEIFRK